MDHRVVMPPLPAHPTVSEVIGRQWLRLPPLLRALLPAVCITLIVLMSANWLIRSRIYALTTEGLQGQHREALSEIGNAFDEFFSASSAYLGSLAARESVQGCAASDCADKSDAVFKPELVSVLRSRELNVIEVGYISLRGVETARAIRGSGNVPLAPGDLPMFQADPMALEQLRVMPIGEMYISPIGRDLRISPSEAYQQPVVRVVFPVAVNDQRMGYVTAVLGLDDFFTLHFTPLETRKVYLLDTEKCLLASSDVEQRSVLYKTWSSAVDRSCSRDLPVQDWDVIVQSYGDSIFSARVLHGSLNLSAQSWTIVIQQPTAVAYAQANALDTFMTAVHLVTVLLVALLVVGTDRARERLLDTAREASESPPADRL